MNLYGISNVLLTIGSLSVAILVSIKGYKNHLTRIWALFAVSVAIYGFGAFMVSNTTTAERAIFWWQISYIGIITMPFLFLRFIYEFVNIRRPIIIRFFAIATLIFLIANFTSRKLFLDGATLYFVDWKFVKPLYFIYPIGPLLFVFIICSFFGSIAYAHFELVKKYKSATSIERNRIKYFFVATALGFAGGGMSFLPCFNISFYPIFNFTVVLSPIIITYAILRHQLMDIEVIIKKTLVFTGLFGFVFSIIVVVAILTQELVAKYFVHSRYLALAISAAIIVFLQQPVYNFLVNITNKYLFQKKYDPRKMLKDFSNEALTILNLDTLCKITIEALVRHLYLSNCAILLLSREEIGYQIYDSFGIEGKGIYFDSESSLVTSLKAGYSPLLRQSYENGMQASKSAKKDMEKIKSEVCLPLVIHNEMVGILSLGAKKSDQPYDENDIDILITLMKALSIAISNARLFMQAAQNEKLATIGTITSAINHEICRPLGTISGNMQLFTLELERGGYSNHDELLKKVKSIIRDSEKQIRKAVNITSRLSGFAKPSNVVETKPIDVLKSIEEALILLKHKLELDKIQVQISIPLNLPKIMVDEDQLQQMVFNLIRNASEAITKNGTIIINAKEEQDKIRIEIKDTGCGIPKDKLDKVFQPFYTTKGEAKGSGYGLAVVKELVQRNNGNITVESEAGKGTTFYLEFQKA